MIVDTNALSEFADGNERVRELLAAASGPYLPVVVIGEYRFGLLLSRERKKRLEWLSELTEYWTVLDVTERTTSAYAEIRVTLREKGQPVPANDVWISALAREHDLPILSNDLHFDAVPGVERLAY